jgi:hypothetical protein
MKYNFLLTVCVTLFTTGLVRGRGRGREGGGRREEGGGRREEGGGRREEGEGEGEGDH